MEQREAERAAKTRIPTAFSLPNVGKSFANFQWGSARRRIGRGSSLSTLYFGWGKRGGWFLCADALGPLRFSTKPRRAEDVGAAVEGAVSESKLPSTCVSLFSLIVESFPSLLLSDSQPAATAETKKSKKKNPTKRVSNVSKEEERGGREGGASVVRLLRPYDSRVL